MARAKKAPVVKSVIIEGAPVIERAIVRFSHNVLQFTVENGDQISYEVLETLENPEVADAIEYATVRFSEVVCLFVVTNGTTVHAYELEPVYQEIGGGTTYTITNNLTNVTNSNAAASIGDGDSYNATLTAAAGYTIDSVVITMGGNDVTASVYNSGVISIPAVTGNIVITASASGGVVENFDKVGNPTIVSGILTPAVNNFIKTPQAFNPGSDPWEIQVKYKYNTAINNADVAGSVNSNNASINGILLEMQSDKSVSGYLSSNGTSWDISNNLGQIYALNTTSNTWILAKLTYTGSNYDLNISTDDGDTWTRTGNLASSTPIIGSYPVAFGLKRNNTMDGEIDLNACKIYINNQLWWEAYN